MDCGKRQLRRERLWRKKGRRLFRDSEDTMAVSAGKELKRHRSGTVDGIHVAAGRAKAAVAAKGRTSILRSGDSGTLRRRKKGHRSESFFQHSQ